MYENDRTILKLVGGGFIALLLLITLFSAFRVIGTGEVGVVTQYGRVTGREVSEGLALVAPWGVNSVTKYDVKTQKVEAQSAAATKDLQDVNTNIVLTYNLNRGKVSDVHKNVGADYQAVEIDPQVQEAFKAVSAQYTASELITRRPEVKQAVIENLRERLEANDRYTIQDIAITDFKFSAAFNQSIEQTQVAQQEVLRTKQELERVRVEADKQIAQAQAAAEAQRLQQQTLTPELLRKYEIDAQRAAIDKWNGALPTTQAGENSLFNIPVR